MDNLGKFKQGVYLKINGFARDVSTKIKRRLCELGLFVGQKVNILQKSALKKVLLIEVRGYVLSLRREQAEMVLAEVWR